MKQVEVARCERIGSHSNQNIFAVDRSARAECMGELNFFRKTGTQELGQGGLEAQSRNRVKFWTRPRNA
eukprot:15478936-Alexandrium_andersonii.AAC.1